MKRVINYLRLHSRQFYLAKRKKLINQVSSYCKRVLPLAKGETEGVVKWQNRRVAGLSKGMQRQKSMLTNERDCYEKSPLERGFRGVSKNKTPLLTGKALLFGILVFGILNTACISEKEDPDRPDLESIEILPEVVFTVVDDEPLQFFIESRGVVEPVQRIQITPRIGGFIESHQIVDGNTVQKGEVILQLNKEEWEFRKQEAYNQLLKAKAEFDVEMQLRGGEGTNGETEGYRITTGLADAELAYERAKLDLSYTTIAAPFSGMISTKEVISDGAFIGAGRELGTLINSSRVKIRFDVLEKEIVQLDKGMEMELEDPAGNRHTGTIVAVSPEIDPRTKTGQVIAEVNNEGKALKPGMTVEGRVFVRSETGKVRMPRESLLERDGRTLVFRLNSGEVEWIYVTPDAMNTDWVIINHPNIDPGDTLAVDKHFSISHQQKVIPLMSGTK